MTDRSPDRDVTPTERSIDPPDDRDLRHQRREWERARKYWQHRQSTEDES